MKTMNKMLYSVFAFQFLLICLWATLSMFWNKQNQEMHIYLDIKGEMDFK